MGTHTSSNPFQITNVQLFALGTHLSLDHATDDMLLTSQFATLTFTNQKNGIWGEVIGLASSSHPYFCPALCLT